MTALALILGRAGSKGLPGKNMLPVAGRPCAAWTMDAARDSIADRCAVTTDCPHLQWLALQAGIDVVSRPDELATDDATVDAAARHAVEALQDEAIDVIALLYANVPVRPVGLIDRVVRTLRDTGADSVQSYCPVGKHHPWWTARLDPDSGAATPWEGDELNHGVFRRQNLPPAHVPDGGALAVTRDALFLRIEGAPAGPHAFLGRDRRGVETQPGAVIDIDSEIDRKVAEATLLERPNPAMLTT